MSPKLMILWKTKAYLCSTVETRDYAIGRLKLRFSNLVTMEIGELQLKSPNYIVSGLHRGAKVQLSLS